MRPTYVRCSSALSACGGLDMMYADAKFVCASGLSGASRSACVHDSIAPGRLSSVSGAERTLLVLANAQVVVGRRILVHLDTLPVRSLRTL